MPLLYIHAHQSCLITLQYIYKCKFTLLMCMSVDLDYL